MGWPTGHGSFMPLPKTERMAIRNLLILGAGTAGTLLANKLQHRLARDEWTITIVDRSGLHYYQPGFLFLPFGLYHPEQVVRPTRDLLLLGVQLRLGEV